MMNYNELLNIDESRFVEYPEDSEILKQKIRELTEIYRQKKILEQAERGILTSMSNPEDVQRTVNLSTEAARNIMQSDLTRENYTEEPFKTFSDEDKEFFDSRKYKPVYNLHSKVTSDEVVKEGLMVLRKEKAYDGRKQMRKKTPNDYLSSFANSKLIADMAKRQREQEERLARLELAQKQNEDKFDQIGNALMLHESKIKALLVLGVDQKKIDVWKTHIESPGLTRQQLADLHNKSKPTIIKWLKDVQSELDSLPR